MAAPTIFMRKINKTLREFNLLTFQSLGNDGWFTPQTQAELFSYGINYKKNGDIPIMAYMTSHDDRDDDTVEELRVCIGYVNRSEGKIMFYLHEYCSFNAMNIPRAIENLGSFKEFCKKAWGIKTTS